LQGHLAEVTTLAFSPDSKNVCSAGKDGSVKFWSLQREQKDDLLPGSWEPLGFSNEGRTLVAINYRQNVISLFNTATFQSENDLVLEPVRRMPGFNSVVFGAAAGAYACALDNGAFKVCNVDTRETRLVHLPIRRNENSLAAISPDARSLMTRTWDQLRWWDLQETNRPAISLEGQRLLFSPDARTLAVFKRGNSIAIWDVHSKSLRTNIVVDPAPGFATAFSPDGRVLALGAGNDDVENSVRLLDVQTGKLLGVCIGHKQGVVSVCFSPDGRTLATAGDDSTLRFWNVANQQELLTIRRLGGTLHSLMFSPDGQILVGATGFPRRSVGIRFFRAPQLKETDLVESGSSEGSFHLSAAHQ
jgi:WD40 repeat protein